MTQNDQGIAGSLQNVLQSEDLKKALPYLLAGGAGALAGGIATGGRRERKGESRTSHAARVLRNALLAGGLAAGGTALIGKGLQNTTGSVDSKGPVTGATADNEGPLASSLKGLLFSPATAAAAGAAGLGLTHNVPGIGAKDPRAAGALKSLAKALTGGDEAALSHLSPQELQAKIDVKGLIHGADANAMRRTAGLAAGKGARGVLSKILHSAPISTLGHTPGRIAGRTALGLAAASIPALAGAFITDKQQPA